MEVSEQVNTIENSNNSDKNVETIKLKLDTDEIIQAESNEIHENGLNGTAKQNGTVENGEKPKVEDTKIVEEVENNDDSDQPKILSTTAIVENVPVSEIAVEGKSEELISTEIATPYSLSAATEVLPQEENVSFVEIEPVLQVSADNAEIVAPTENEEVVDSTQNEKVVDSAQNEEVVATNTDVTIAENTTEATPYSVSDVTTEEATPEEIVPATVEITPPEATISNNVPKPTITGKTLPAFVINALENIAHNNGYQHYNINISSGSQHAEGFIADIFRVVIADGIKHDNKIVLIVKLPPENKMRRELMGMKLFRTEVDVYNRILPLFEKFQKSKGLNESNGFYSYPKCYFATYDEDKDESVIIMEDIRLNDFSMEDRFRPVQYEHAKSVMINLAQFHAVSLAMKEQWPEEFSQFTNVYDNFLDMYKMEHMKDYVGMNVNKAINTLDDGDEKIKEKLRNHAEIYLDEVNRLSDVKLSEPHSVLIHGDFHINNLMFRYESGIPKYTSIFDWQLLRYASPAIDIAYFIYMGTDKALRDKHFDHLIQAYHNSLREQLERLGSDVNQLFPFTALLRHLKQFTRLLLITFLFAIPLLCMERNDIPDMNDVADLMVNSEQPIDILAKINEVKYKQRMSDLLRDLNRKGYI